MARSQIRKTLSSGVAALSFTVPSSTEAYNTAEGMVNLVRRGGGFGLRPGVDSIRDGEESIFEDAKPSDDGFFYLNGGAVSYRDLRSGVDISGVSGKNSLEGLQAVRLKDVIVFRGSAVFKFCRLLYSEELFDFTYNDDVYPPFRSYLYPSRRDLVFRTPTEGRVASFIVPKALFRVGLIVSVVSEDFSEHIGEVKFVRESTSNPLNDDVAVEVFGESALGTGFDDVVELRVFDIPDAIGKAAGRLIAVSGESMSFSRIGNPFLFREDRIDHVDGTQVVYESPASAFTQHLGLSFRESINKIQNVNHTVYLYGDNFFRVISSDNAFSAGSLVSNTEDVIGSVVGLLDSQVITADGLGRMSTIIWDANRRILGTSRRFSVYHDELLSAGVKSVVEESNGSQSIIVLKDGRCIVADFLGQGKYSMLPQRFYGEVVDVMVFKGDFYLFLRDGGEVSVRKWRADSDTKWDNHPNDIEGYADISYRQGDLTVVPYASVGVYVKGKGEGALIDGIRQTSNAFVALRQRTLFQKPVRLTILGYGTTIDEVFMEFTWSEKRR